MVQQGRPSKITAADWKHNGSSPAPKPPYGTKPPGILIDVGDGHKIFAQQFGNPDGEPLVFFHGGPGSGCEDAFVRMCDQNRYKIILFDQRGCGHSEPTMHTDFQAAMKGNNTAKLVDDVEHVRQAFGIKGKMHIQGGSWGTTFALAYAVKHPEKVKSLVLRGIFLGDQASIDYLFQGNATSYDTSIEPVTHTSSPEAIKRFMEHFNKQDSTKEGAYRTYMGDGTKPGQIPKKYHFDHMKFAYARAWDAYVRMIPKDKRDNMPRAYHEVFDRVPKDEDERQTQQRAALAYSEWEATCSYFNHKLEADGSIDLGNNSKLEHATNLARLESIYNSSGFFLNENGDAVHDSQYLWGNLGRLKEHDVHIFVADGAYDQATPTRDGERFVKQYRDELKGKIIYKAVPEAGHSQRERNTTAELIKMIKTLPKMTEIEKQGLDPKTPTEQAERKGAHVLA